jgi:hypothetical protein
MGGGAASRTDVPRVVFRVGATFHPLPSGAELAAVFRPERFIDTLGEGVMEVVPSAGNDAVDDPMWVSTKANGTTWECGGGSVTKRSMFLGC